MVPLLSIYVPCMRSLSPLLVSQNSISQCNSIPISWDSDEIAYYVGFQVDLVVQPSAILDKMKNGTCAFHFSFAYSCFTPTDEDDVMTDVVNYSLRDTVLPPAQEPTIDTLDSMMFDAQLNLEPTLTADPTCAIIDTLEKKGLRSIGKDVSHRQFNRMLFDHVRCCFPPAVQRVRLSVVFDSATTLSTSCH